MKILIVEDDKHLNTAICDMLGKIAQTEPIYDGEEAMSITMYTDQSADGITFIADGIVEMDVVKYCLG